MTRERSRRHRPKPPMTTRRKRPMHGGTRKKMNCAPAVEGANLSKDTCYTGDIIKEIKEAYNSKNPTHPIKTNDPVHILAYLKDTLKCEKESCFLSLLNETQRQFIEEKIFAPAKPEKWNKNPHEWLSSTDIERVMKQYEAKYLDFKFVGTSPIDFDTKLQKDVCVVNDLCHFEIASYLKDGFKQIGIIFNLDKHTGKGTHWVAMYINLQRRLIFYFDSAANETPKEIGVFVDRLLSQASQISSIGRFRYMENFPNQHQRGNTECGMYCLYFLITMISKRKKINLFLKGRIPDGAVAALRTKYFN